MPRMSTKFMPEQDVIIYQSRYANNSPALVIVSQDNQPLMKPTVYIPQIILNPDQVIIKDYSENSGILIELQRLNIVSQPEFYITSGFVDFPVCQLMPETEWLEHNPSLTDEL